MSSNRFDQPLWIDLTPAIRWRVFQTSLVITAIAAIAWSDFSIWFQSALLVGVALIAISLWRNPRESRRLFIDQSGQPYLVLPEGDRIAVFLQGRVFSVNGLVLAQVCARGGSSVSLVIDTRSLGRFQKHQLGVALRLSRVENS